MFEVLTTPVLYVNIAKTTMFTCNIKHVDMAILDMCIFHLLAVVKIWPRRFMAEVGEVQEVEGDAQAPPEPSDDAEAPAVQQSGGLSWCVLREEAGRGGGVRADSGDAVAVHVAAACVRARHTAHSAQLGGLGSRARCLGRTGARP